MRTLIVIVILQVANDNQNAQFRFGDLIAFPSCNCITKSIYKHYAVYVGDKNFECKKKLQDIFERTGPIITMTSLADCIFGKLDVKAKHFKDNYLDGMNKYPVGSDEEIRKRILEKYRDCGTYGPLVNNCEHLATYVRYGKKVSVQHGTYFEEKCENDPDINVNKILNSMNNKMPYKYDEICSDKCQIMTQKGNG